MGEKQHTADVEHKLNHVMVQSSVEGGQCLNRHMGRQHCTCSHQYQGYWRATLTPKLYNWNKYEHVGNTKLAFRTKSGFAFRNRKQPKEKEWDVDKPGRNNKTNHKDSSSIPYYHESHHIIPNSVLNGTIQDMFGSVDAVLQAVRGGLLDEGYNLNHHENLILLPLEAVIAKALQLPIHREFNVFGHRTYSKHVKTKVKKILGANQQNIDNCELTKYSDMKDQLVDLSRTLFDRIVQAGKDGIASLDEMNKQRFK